MIEEELTWRIDQKFTTNNNPRNQAPNPPKKKGPNIAINSQIPIQNQNYSNIIVSGANQRANRTQNQPHIRDEDTFTIPSEAKLEELDNVVEETKEIVEKLPDNITKTVDGKKVRLEAVKRYVLLNKPAGFVCSSSDEKGREVAADLLKDKYKYLQ